VFLNAKRRSVKSNSGGLLQVGRWLTQTSPGQLAVWVNRTACRLTFAEIFCLGRQTNDSAENARSDPKNSQWRFLSPD
jgi:hypothetical protein